jgi:hypothetical protein
MQDTDDTIATLAALRLAIVHAGQARTLLLPLRLPVAAECRSLTGTLDRLRELRAEARGARRPAPRLLRALVEVRDVLAALQGPDEQERYLMAVVTDALGPPAAAGAGPGLRG